jgi:hypothetical protein
MANVHDDLSYHGRRSVDELVRALNANHTKAALIHKELSQLHLNRFVSAIVSTADQIDDERP